MGLDNIPDPYPCAGKETTIRKSNDKLDCKAMQEKGACPVVNLQHPIGILGTDCWFRGKVIARDLEALGYSSLGYEFYEDKCLDEIHPLMEEIKETFEEIKRKHEENHEPITGGLSMQQYENGALIRQEFNNYEDIVRVFEDTIKWLEMLEQNECGFKAWW